MIYHILRFKWTSVHTRYAVKDMRTFRSTISFYCLIFSDHKDYMDLLNNPLIFEKFVDKVMRTFISNYESFLWNMVFA